MYNDIKHPEDFIDKLIDDTWLDKLIWSIYETEYGTRYIILISIPKTKKYLKVEIFDPGSIDYTWLKVDLIITSQKKVEFSILKSADYKDRLSNLVLAIKRQIAAKIAIIN